MMEQAKNTNQMAERFRNLEVNFSNKLDRTVMQYEDKITNMQESHKKDLRRLEETFAQRWQDRERGQKMEKEAIEMKYEARIAQLNQVHDEEKDRTLKVHQEELKGLSTKMSQMSAASNSKKV
jgi:hypothetical protein